MCLTALCQVSRKLLEMMTRVFSGGLFTSQVPTGPFESRSYRQCDPRAPRQSCLRIVYPHEPRTGIIKFPGPAASRPMSRTGPDRDVP